MARMGTHNAKERVQIIHQNNGWSERIPQHTFRNLDRLHPSCPALGRALPGLPYANPSFFGS